MTRTRTFRRYELFFISVLTAVYAIRRLLEEARAFDAKVETAEQAKIYTTFIWRDLAGYNHTFNAIFPILAGAILLLSGWYVFHYLAYPQFKTHQYDEKLLFYVALTLVLVFGSVYIHDHFRLYVQFRYDKNHHLAGFSVVSLFRKLYLFYDAIAVLVMLGMYELLSQWLYYFQDKISEEKEAGYRNLSYFLTACVAVLLLLTALTARLPTILKEDIFIRNIIPIAVFYGCLYTLQQFFLQYILPKLNESFTIELRINLLVFLLLDFIGSLLFAGIKTDFHFHLNSPTFLLTFIAFTVFAVFIAYYNKSKNKEKIQLQTQVRVKSAELMVLRSQVNPHFLFNALNTLYSVALKEKAEKTSDGIQKLGDMMRFMLHENNQERILLSKETEYLHNFIDIQKMRLEGIPGIEIKINVQQPEHEIYLAPMLLNPFVENAFKHGISFRQPSWIFITLTLDATRLYFKVHNSLHPKPTHDPEAEHAGVGLENVKKRLQLLYPNRHELSIQASEQDYFVSLILNLTI